MRREALAFTSRRMKGFSPPNLAKEGVEPWHLPLHLRRILRSNVSNSMGKKGIKVTCSKPEVVHVEVTIQTCTSQCRTEINAYYAVPNRISNMYM